MSIKETLNKINLLLLQACDAYEKAEDNSPDKLEIWEENRANLTQFITEEIKLAVEEIIKSRQAENAYSINTFEAGYKAKEFEIQWNLNKYFE